MKSELEQYYEVFETAQWTNEDSEECPCGGDGWVLSSVDTWHQCPIHYNGQVCPEDYRG